MVRQIARRKTRQPASSGNGHLRVLTTLPAVVRELHGKPNVAALVGVTVQAVDNWWRKGKFPPAHFDAMREALREKGYDAPPELWCQTKRRE